jgi:hypothetical protein
VQAVSGAIYSNVDAQWLHSDIRDGPDSFCLVPAGYWIVTALQPINIKINAPIGFFCAQ